MTGKLTPYPVSQGVPNRCVVANGQHKILSRHNTASLLFLQQRMLQRHISQGCGLGGVLRRESVCLWRGRSSGEPRCWLTLALAPEDAKTEERAPESDKRSVKSHFGQSRSRMFLASTTIVCCGIFVPRITAETPTTPEWLKGGPTSQQTVSSGCSHLQTGLVETLDECKKLDEKYKMILYDIQAIFSCCRTNHNDAGHNTYQQN